VWVTKPLMEFYSGGLLRGFLAMGLLFSLCLVFSAVATLIARSRGNKVTASKDSLRKSATSSNPVPIGHTESRPSPRSTQDGTNSPVRVAGMAICITLATVGMFSIPVEHASVVNQEKETGWLYLPHVDEDLDQFHFWVVNERGERVFLTFCSDKGFVPQWNEGQTVKFKYRAWPTCLEMLSVYGLRDAKQKLIER
jgi:hypothetical protein